MSGCTSSDARAKDALIAYQAASAANDVIGARQALLRLVRAKDDVPDYWVELGKLQASTGNFSDAYYAFTRAYELDRSNVDILRAVTELALRSGDIGLAQSHAEELEVLSPGDPWVKLTNGWDAFTQSHFDEAIADADGILANTPYSSPAIVLKARALVSLGREDAAAELLTKQVKAQPSDLGSLQVLSRIYLRRSDWGNLVPVTAQMYRLNPSDQANGLLLVEAALRANNVAAAREASFHLLKSNAEPTLIASVLHLWTDYWPSPQRIRDAKSLAASSGAEQKLVYAEFLARNARPGDAISLIGGAAGLPVTAANAEANAVLADAWARSGNIGGAMSRFNAVIGFDPGNATALRDRAELELATRDSANAIKDAQKLVTVLPSSSDDRLLLARSYAAAGNSAWVDRTLWTAFQAIPADEKIYTALLATRKGNSDATRTLQDEFDRQRDARLNRGLF
jgi:predicted Zn-dependent protease